MKLSGRRTDRFVDTGCHTLKNALIIGLGDVLKGDEGVGSFLIEILAQDIPGDSVHLTYLGDDPRWAGGLIHAADLVLIVGAFALGGPPGRFHMWSYKVFQRHVDWMANVYQTIQFLAQALARAELAGGLPKDLTFLWIEPYKIEGFGMSGQMRKAMWKGVGEIKQRLSARGLLPEKALKVSRFFSVNPVYPHKGD